MAERDRQEEIRKMKGRGWGEERWGVGREERRGREEERKGLEIV